MIAGVILAGGASRRMGSPKALLPVRGETFLDRLIGVVGAHCQPVIVVLGYEAETIRKGLAKASEAQLVVNPSPERGQLSSLQCGLREVPDRAPGALYLPVDYPMVEAATVATLVDRAGAMEDAEAIVPVCEERHGHPVCISRRLIAELLALPEGSTAREVIHRWREHTVYVPVADRGVLRDVDDPETYRRLVDS